MTHPRTTLGAIPLLVGLALASGCGGEEETPKLFDEAGAWSLINYDFGEGVRDVDPMNRKDAFMLSFDVANSVVQTAACVDEETGSVTPANSPCLLTPTDTEWVCHCFAYAFENDNMKWREFDAGSMPPMVSFDDAGADGSPPPSDDAAATGGDSGGSGDGGDGGTAGGPPPGADFLITVAEVADISATYTFLPLPTGIFGSDGSTSRFIMQARAPSLFNRAFEDPEGRATCEPCI